MKIKMFSKITNALITTFLLTSFSISTFNINVSAAEINNDEPTVVAQSAVLMDAKTGIVIFEKDMDEKQYPASITKVMTALLAIQRSKLSERVSFSHEAVFTIPYGSSHIAMDEGETLSMEEALYGLMLPSANEVANAIAEHVSGSVENFSKLMTETAKSLGAKNTNFKNPNGLHNENHFTTAYDMALIMREAVKLPFFVEVIGTRRYDIPPTEKQPEVRVMHNSNKMIMQGEYFNEDVVGGKTGFTNEAMHTLATYGKRDEMELVVVTLHDEKNKIYTDTTELLNYGFSQFKNVTVYDKETLLADVQKTEAKTIDGEAVSLMLADEAKSKLVMNLPKAVEGKLKNEVSFINDIKAPLEKGAVVGTVTVSYGDIKLATVDVLSAEEVEVSDEAKKEAKKAAKKEAEEEVASEKKDLGFSPFFTLTLVSILLVLYAVRDYRAAKYKLRYKYGKRG